MKWPTFYVEELDVGARVVSLAKDEANHAFRVMRLKEGETCFVVDGGGHKVRGTVSADKTIKVGEVIHAVRPFGEIAWMISALAGSDLKLIIQTATSLGVERVYVVETQFSQGSRKDTIKVLDKMNKVVISAQKMASIPFQPHVVCDDFESVITRYEGAIVAFHQAGESGLGETTGQRDARPLLCFGPEGGFSDAEVQMLKAHQVRLVSLGDVNLTSVQVVSFATAYYLGWQHA